ncbi:unnamed protein product [Victoria cruziana]
MSRYQFCRDAKKIKVCGFRMSKLIFFVRSFCAYTCHSCFRLTLLIYAEMQTIFMIQARKSAYRIFH